MPKKGDRTAVRSGRDPSLAFALAIFLLLEIGTVSVWTIVSNLTAQARQQTFEQNAAQVERLVGASALNATHFLGAFEALFQSSTDVTYAEYARAFEIVDTSIGGANIIAVAYLEHVTHAEREAYEERMQNDTLLVPQGFPSFAITPAGQRAEYLPVTYFEPYNDLNRVAHGFDVLTEPNRRAALEKARDTGAVTVTPQVQIVRADSPRGFAFYAPLYDPDLPTTDVTERRLAFRGAITLILETSKFFNEAVDELLISPDVDIEVYDGSVGQGNLFFDRNPAVDLTAANPADVRDIPLQVADRTWLVRVTYQPAGTVFGEWTSTAVLGIGLVLSAIVSLSVRDLLRARRRTITTAQGMITRLRAAEQDYEEILESSLDPVITTNVDGSIRSINSAAERAVGYARNEIVGKHFGQSGLIPATAIPAALEHFTASLGGKRSAPYSLPIRHKDGTTHTYEVQSRPLFHDDKVVGVQVMARLNTERTQALKRVAALETQLKEANSFIVEQERKHVALQQENSELKRRQRKRQK